MFKLYDNYENRYEIKYDKDLKNKIMISNYKPSENTTWNDNNLSTNTIKKVNPLSSKNYDFDSITSELNPETNLNIWIGKNENKDLNSEQYKYIINQINDKLNIFTLYLKNTNGILDIPYQYKDNKEKLDWSDFRTINNLNILDQYYFKDNENHCTYILDIGGGFGRLTEAIKKYYSNKKIKIVLLDNYLHSLVYVLCYLKQKLKLNVKVGNIYEGDEFDLDKYDIIVIDYNSFLKLNKYKYDIVINITSFQETNKKIINNYLQLTNNLLNKNGILYSENLLNYKCIFDYNIPDNWSVLKKSKAPFSSIKYKKYDISLVAKKVNNSENLNHSYVANFNTDNIF